MQDTILKTVSCTSSEVVDIYVIEVAEFNVVNKLTIFDFDKIRY